MSRKEEIKQAAEEHAKSSLVGSLFYKESSFRQGAEWADKNPNEQMIAKYLYENKGYPIDLNGNLPSFEETMKDVKLYDEYKKKKLIDKACDFIKDKLPMEYDGLSDYIKDLRKTMMEE